MDSAVFVWLTAFFMIFLAIVIHVFYLRVIKPKDPFVFINRFLFVLIPVVFGGAMLGYESAKNAGIIRPSSDLILGLQAGGLLIFIFLPFLSFYALIVHAVRARIAMELYRAPEGLAVSLLMKRYDPHAETVRRLDELAAAGFLVRSSDTYTLTVKGSHFASAASELRGFLKL